MVMSLLSPFRAVTFAMAENTLNSLLEEHPWAQHKLSELGGKVIVFTVSNLEQSVEIQIRGGFLHIGPAQSDAPDATISAPLATWLTMARNKGSHLSGDGISVKGDIMLFAALNDIWRNEQWAPEMALAPLFGHSGAHIAGQIGRTLLEGFKKHSHTTERHASDFLKNEQQTLINRWELEQFTHANEALSDRVSRLQARLNALQQRIEQPPSP